jgi:biotin carboxyl carrier protein
VIEFVPKEGGEVVLRRDGAERAWLVRRHGAHVAVAREGERFVLSRDVASAAGGGGAPAGARAGELRAPMPGVVVRVMVAEGDAVTARQPLAVLEAMKMEHIIESTMDGVVRRVLVTEGDRVAEGDVLIEVAGGIDPADG